MQFHAQTMHNNSIENYKCWAEYERRQEHTTKQMHFKIWTTKQPRTQLQLDLSSQTCLPVLQEFPCLSCWELVASISNIPSLARPSQNCKPTMATLRRKPFLEPPKNLGLCGKGSTVWVELVLLGSCHDHAASLGWLELQGARLTHAMQCRAWKGVEGRHV